jgi:nitrite transporter
MVLFLISLAVPHPEAVNLAGAVHNLLPVTIGKIVGGRLFVVVLCVYLSNKQQSETVQKEAALPLGKRHVAKLKMNHSH